MMMKTRVKALPLLAMATILFAGAAWAQPSAPDRRALAPFGPTIGYADLADLALAARVAVVATVHDATRLKGPTRSAWRRARHVSMWSATSTRSSWGPACPRASPGWSICPTTPRIGRRSSRSRSWCCWRERARANRARCSWSHAAPSLAGPPALESQLRGILRELNGAGALPVVTGIGHAFHVAGSIPGEGETQIFLKTRGQPPGVAVGTTPSWRGYALVGVAG